MVEKKPFDPEDTDWGREVNQRHQENVERFAIMNSKLETIEGHMALDLREHGLLRAELERNTEKTDRTERNTQTLVLLFQGGRVWGRILIGLAMIFSGIAAVGVWLGWLTPHAK